MREDPAPMRRETPVLVRLALGVVRAIGLIVPRRDRRAWRREWESEIRYSQGQTANHLDWSDQMTLFRRSLGSVSDAAWLRRQFTRDSELVQDLRHTVRLLRARPSFFLLAVFVMALGIGSATAVFSVTDAILMRELPYPDAKSLVAIWQRDTTDPDVIRGEVASGNFVDWRDEATTFEAIAAAEPFSMDYTGGDRPEVFFATLVTEHFFDILRVRPLHGRLFQAGDFVSGQSRVVLLEHSLWQGRFGSDASLVGRTIPLDGQPFTVIGVLPPDLELNLLPAPGRRGIWVPKVLQEYERRTRGNGWWATIGRLRPGVTIDQAQADLDRISTRLAADFPRTNANMRAWVEPLSEHLVGDARPALALLLAAVAVVLLIACANVANMMLARAADRDRELAVRGALGASRGRLARQLLSESMFVSLLGTMGGVVLAVWLLDAIVALAPREIPRIADVALNWRLAFAAVGVGLLAGLLAGLVPAWQFSRPRSPESLGSGRGSTAHRTGRLMRDGLATAEIALAVALVVGAGLLLRSFTTLVAVDPGFRSDGVLALQVFAWDRQDSPARQQAFFRNTIADLRALPGVVDAGAVSAMPLIDANINVQGPYTIEGRPPLPSGQQDIASLTIATPGYFSVMDIPVVRGRTFTPEDRAGSEPVAVVSEAFAEHHWPGADPLGSWIVTRFSGQPQRVKIVGVVGELRHDSLDQPGREEIFLPLDQVGFGSITYVIRTSGDPAPLAETAKQAIWRHDPLLTFYDTKTVDELVSASVAPRRFSLVLVGAFAVVALVLAAAGIYGVLSFTTQRQTREFGVRMAMGATSREIARLVIGRGVRLGLIGLAIGVGAALWAGRSMQSMLYEVSPFDPVTFGSVSAIALGISVLACYVPARRAMRVDPLVALRD